MTDKHKPLMYRAPSVSVQNNWVDDFDKHGLQRNPSCLSVIAQHFAWTLLILFGLLVFLMLPQIGTAIADAVTQTGGMIP